MSERRDLSVILDDYRKHPESDEKWWRSMEYLWEAGSAVNEKVVTITYGQSSDELLQLAKQVYCILSDEDELEIDDYSPLGDFFKALLDWGFDNACVNIALALGVCPSAIKHFLYEPEVYIDFQDAHQKHCEVVASKDSSKSKDTELCTCLLATPSENGPSNEPLTQLPAEGTITG